MAKLRENMSKTKILAEPLAEPKKFENFDVSFQLYNETYQEVKLKDLNKSQLKALNLLILEIIKCKNEEELGRINRGKTCPKKNCSLAGHELKDELIHLGKDATPFRLHGVLYGQSFKIICIDPNHQIHRM